MWRRTFIILAVLCGALAGTVIAIKSRRVADNVKVYLAHLAKEQFGVTLKIDELEVEIFPPGIAVDGVAVFRPELEAPWLTLHHGRVLIRPWPSAAGALVIHHLEVDGLRGDIDLRGKGNLLSPQGPTPSRLSIDIRQLLVWNTDLSLRTDAFELRLNRADFQLRPILQGRRVTVSIEAAELTVGDQRISFELSTRGLFRGTLDRPESLAIERAFLSLDEVFVGVTGSAILADPPHLDIEMKMAAPVSRLARLDASLPHFGGHAECELRIKGPLAHPRTRARVVVDALSIDWRTIGDIEADAIFEPERLTIESFHVSNRSAGTVTGSGTVELGERMPLAFAARLHGASLPHILELADLPDTWVPLHLSGDVRGTGELRPFRLSLDVDSTVHRFTVLDGSFREPESTVMMAIDRTALDGRVGISPWAVTLSDMTLVTGETEMNVSGTLSFDEAQGLDLKAWSERVNMADIGPIADVAYEGTGAVAATIEGPYEGPTVSGTVDLDDFAVQGYALGDTQGTIIFSDEKLTIDRATVRHGRGNVKGSGAFDFASTEPRVRADFELHHVEARHILETLNIHDRLTSRLSAPLSGKLQIAGPLMRPAGSLRVTGADLRIDGISLGHVALTGGFGEAQEVLWGELTIAPDKGKLEARAAWRADETLTLRAEAASIPLTSIRPFVGDPDVDGRLTGTTTLSGPPDRLSGRIDTVITHLTVAGIPFETTRVASIVEAGQMKLSGTTLGGTTSADATIKLGRYLPYTVTATCERLDVGSLLNVPDALEITATGTLFSQGNLTRPDSVTADVQFESTDMRWGHWALHSVRPVRLQYADGVIRVSELALAGRGAQMSVDGEISADGDLDLRAGISGDLRHGSWTGSKVEWLRGRLEIASRIGGTLHQPQLGGSASLTGGALRLAATRQALEELNAELSLAGRSITIDSGTAKLGGGRVTLGGQIVLPIGGPSDFSVRADLDAVKLLPQPELYATVTGNLNLVGPIDDLLLRGRLTLDELRYTASFDLDRLIPRRHAPPLRVPALDPDATVRLAIGVQADNNVILQNNVVEAELQADLTVTGTSERVGLIGSVTPLWARARYLNNVFVVQRGSIDFSEEFRIFTQFDLRATTEACDMRITVDVHGNSDVYNVAAKGEDENGAVDQNDVLACLQFGLRRQDFDAQLSAANATESEESSPLSNPMLASSLDVLWTVSGMDVKIRKLLPIELDEVRLESGWSSHFGRTTTRVRVGKDLGTNLQLKYARSLDEIDDQTLSIEYRLSDVAALEGNWLSASNVSVGDFGLDLRLRWEFR